MNVNYSQTIDMSYSNIKKIKKKIYLKIRDCFENFEERYKDFNYYRQVIRHEPQKFIEDLRKIFVKVET